MGNATAGKLVHKVNQYARTQPEFSPSLGRMVTQLADQVKGRDIARQEKKYSSYPQNGSVSSGYLSNGSQVMQYIITGKPNQITRAWIYFQVRVTAPVKLLPAFMWIDTLTTFQDASATKAQDANWFTILLGMSNMFPSMFEPMTKDMLCDDEDGWTTAFLPPATYNVYVPLYDSTLLTGAHLFYYPPNITVQIRSPLGGCIEQGSPNSVSVVSSYVLLEETAVHASMAVIIEQSFLHTHVRNFLDWQVLSCQDVTVTGNNYIDIIMTTLDGVCPFLVYGLRDSVTKNNPAFGACKRFIPLSTNIGSCTVNLLDATGSPILNQAIDPYLQQMVMSEHSFGRVLNGDWANLYFLEFTQDRIASMNGMLGAGWRKAENNERIRISPTTAYVAEVPRVITLTCVDAAGTAQLATGGQFQLSYCDGYGYTYVTQTLNYNDSQATVQTALNNMVIYGGCVETAGATNVNANGGLSVTITNLSTYDTLVQGAVWSIMTCSLRNASGALFPVLKDVRGSVQVGIAPGTYTPFVLFPRFTQYILDRLPDGIGKASVMPINADKLIPNSVR